MNVTWHKALLVSLLSMVYVTAYAKVATPKFENNFDALLEQSNLAVVHFINYDVLSSYDEFEKDDAMEALQDMKEDFIYLSDDPDFAQIKFIGLDLKAFPYLVETYDISDFSTLMLFKDGKSFKRGGKFIQKVGLLDEYAMEAFIESYFEEFAKELERRAEELAKTSAVDSRTTVTYTPYERRYYYRPFYNRTWYRRPAWRRNYYNRYRRRPYYWRHQRFAPRYRYGRRGGFGFGFGFGGGRGYRGFGLGW